MLYCAVCLDVLFFHLSSHGSSVLTLKTGWELTQSKPIERPTHVKYWFLGGPYGGFPKGWYLQTISKYLSLKYLHICLLNIY